MKHLLFIVLFSLTCIQEGNAQNLVPNPSFEQLDFCPFSINQIEAATGWMNWSESPELYNSCNLGNFNVPNAAFGYQNAHTGVSMAGLLSRRNGSPAQTDVREYIGIQLVYPLTVGTKYFISFYANMANLNCMATNNLGVHFTMNPFSISSPHPIINYAHIFNTNLITDTVNWTYCSGSFVADSAYNYTCLGNFFADSLTPILPHPSNSGYYYIDDVCVSTDSLQCAVMTGFKSINEKKYFKVHQNPFGSHLLIESFTKIDITLFNQLGQKLQTIQLLPGFNNIDLSHLNNAIYYIKNCGESDKGIKLLKY